MKREKKVFKFTDADGIKMECTSWHYEKYGDVPYPKIRRVPTMLTQVAVPYGRETYEEAQKRLPKPQWIE